MNADCRETEEAGPTEPGETRLVPADVEVFAVLDPARNAGVVRVSVRREVSGWFNAWEGWVLRPATLAFAGMLAWAAVAAWICAAVAPAGAMWELTVSGRLMSVPRFTVVFASIPLTEPGRAVFTVAGSMLGAKADRVLPRKPAVAGLEAPVSCACWMAVLDSAFSAATEGPSACTRPN